MKKQSSKDTKSKQIRCAIYTRKSTEEGLGQEFNSLDAQREAAEAFVLSQVGEGWHTLTTRYDDGGFSGGTMIRPALQKLLNDIDAGNVDCVVVYKVDRLSRSLLDFSRMMQRFDERNVSFVSVTQQFNTTHSMGRLTLNILLSFAQFEREIISERTRDKIAATRRKGMWTGGVPVLGYNVSAQRKLIIIPEEAEQVRGIFQVYLKHGSLLPAVNELNARLVKNKLWTTRQGKLIGGQAFTRTSLYLLLTNVTYTGQLRYKKEVHPGEHQAIIDETLWQNVQNQLKRNGSTTTKSQGTRNRFGAILKGLLRCQACDSAMTPTHTSKSETLRYRYYVCSNAQKIGRANCPAKSISATQIEELVVSQILAKLPELQARWPSLTVHEKVQIIHEQITHVDFDGQSKQVSIHFNSITEEVE